MTAGQKVLFEFQGNNYSFTVREATVEGRGKSNSIERGIILEDTFFVFDAPRDSGIKVSFLIFFDIYSTVKLFSTYYKCLLTQLNYPLMLNFTDLIWIMFIQPLF